MLQGLVAQRRVLIAAHGYCFDGITSAALFTKLRSSLNYDQAQFSYSSFGYSPNLKSIPYKKF